MGSSLTHQTSRGSIQSAYFVNVGDVNVVFADAEFGDDLFDIMSEAEEIEKMSIFGQFV